MELSRSKIDLAMERNNLTINQVAEKYGVSSQRIRIILNSKNVTPAVVGRMADALGCDVTEIIETEK